MSKTFPVISNDREILGRSHDSLRLAHWDLSVRFIRTFIYTLLTPKNTPYQIQDIYIDYAAPSDLNVLSRIVVEKNTKAKVCCASERVESDVY